MTDFDERLFVPENLWLVRPEEEHEFWTVISQPYYKINKDQRRQYVCCRCRCGIEKEVLCTNLVNRKSRSCGCLAIENAKKARENWRKGTIALNGLKTCSHCGVEKTTQEFHSQRRTLDKLHHWCRRCCYDARLRKDYGITIEDFEAMLAKQNNCCALCGKEFVLDYTNKRNELRPVVDHCHNTLKVRGLLHLSCNMFIGVYEKYYDRFNPDHFPLFLAYQKQWNDVTETIAA